MSGAHSAWGWKRESTVGLWRSTPAWLRPVTTVVPWATVALLLLMLHMTGGALASAEGVLFDLPAEGLSDTDIASSVALIVPQNRNTFVFFDDARYTLDEETSRKSLGKHLTERAARAESPTILVMADRRIPWGDLARFAATARESGMKKILFATKRTGGSGE